jgi:formate dehydrogenase major subunit
VAQLLKKSRDDTFVVSDQSGKKVMATDAIFSLGGATIDNEWNHVQQKLMRGMGITPIENQARI